MNNFVFRSRGVRLDILMLIWKLACEEIRTFTNDCLYYFRRQHQKLTYIWYFKFFAWHWRLQSGSSASSCVPKVFGRVVFRVRGPCVALRHHFRTTPHAMSFRNFCLITDNLVRSNSLSILRVSCFFSGLQFRYIRGKPMLLHKYGLGLIVSQERTSKLVRQLCRNSTHLSVLRNLFRYRKAWL